MSYIRLIFSFLLLLAAVLFAFSNKQAVDLTFWPTPWKATAPLSVVVLGAMAVAFFAGVLSRWLPSLMLRRRLKRAEADLATSQTQLRAVTQQLTALQLASYPPPPTYTPPPLAPPPYPPDE